MATIDDMIMVNRNPIMAWVPGICVGKCCQINGINNSEPAADTNNDPVACDIGFSGALICLTQKIELIYDTILISIRTTPHGLIFESAESAKTKLRPATATAIPSHCSHTSR